MNNSISIPWDSGTLTCDINADGSVFRLQGNAYCASANSAWSRTSWIPGVSGWAGMRTFKVKPPSDGRAKWIYGAGFAANTDGGMWVGNVNYDRLIVGTDGYVYVMHMTSSPGNDYPIAVSYYGITAHVDSMAQTDGYTYGSGA